MGGGKRLSEQQERRGPGTGYGCHTVAAALAAVVHAHRIRRCAKYGVRTRHSGFYFGTYLGLVAQYVICALYGAEALRVPSLVGVAARQGAAVGAPDLGTVVSRERSYWYLTGCCGQLSSHGQHGKTEWLVWYPRLQAR